jgi:hypothetical protein
MRVKVTNQSPTEGLFLVTYGDGDEDKPARLKRIPAGASLELAITQSGMLQVLDFEARIVPVPKRIRKPETPPETKAR